MTLLPCETILRPKTDAPGLIAKPALQRACASTSSLDIASSLKLMIKSVDAKDFGNTFVSHVTLLNTLDVATTLVQKSLKK